MPDTRYELRITATGELRDAEGNLLDQDGKPVQPDVPEEDEQPEEAS